MNIKIFTRQRNKETENVIFRLRDGRNVDIHHKSEIIVSCKTFSNVKGDVIIPSAKLKDDAYKALVTKQSEIAKRKAFIQDWYIGQLDKTALTSDMLNFAIDKNLHPEKYIVSVIDEQPKHLIAYIEDFIKKAPTRKVKGKNTYISSDTIKSYGSNLARLKRYAKHKRKSDFLLSQVDDKFVSDYVDFLTVSKRTVKTKKGEVVNEVKQYTNNTIGNAMKLLKTFLMDAPYHRVNLKEDIEVFKEVVNNVFLNETELQQLKDFDFTSIPHLDRVRDWFLLLAWTGSRFSDLDKIDKTNIKNGLITYRQKKTNTNVIIPLHPIVEDVLKKYDYEMPELISNQKFNDYIKEACKMAGIDSTESISRTVGGKLVSETMPKYELVSSHTCRRSFCTNMYLRGIDTLMIRSISGHKTESSFLTYIKVGQKEHAERMAKKWSEIYK